MFIFYWCSGYTYPIALIFNSLKWDIPFHIFDILFKLLAARIAVQEIRYFLKMFRVYQESKTSNEEEETILIILTLCKIEGIGISVFCFVDNIMVFLLHYFFLAYFIYDEDSIDRVKQIFRCKTMERKSKIDIINEKKENVIIENLLSTSNN